MSIKDIAYLIPSIKVGMSDGKPPGPGDVLLALPAAGTSSTEETGVITGSAPIECYYLCACQKYAITKISTLVAVYFFSLLYKDVGRAIYCSEPNCNKHNVTVTGIRYETRETKCYL